ncbi:MAG TPA: hypothetical protein VIF62_34790, partial [Labilithrix sp.]
MTKNGGLTFEAVCKMLVQARLLTPEQAREASIREDRERARMTRARSGGTVKRGPTVDSVIHPAEILSVMQLGNLTEKQIMETIAQAANLPFIDLDPLKLDAKLAPQFLSRPFARRHTALVVAATDTTVTVAVADPFDRGLVDDLVNYVRRKPVLVISTPSDIQRLITDFYGFRTAVQAAEEQVTGGVDIG